MKAGVEGKSRIKAKAKGVALPTLPFDAASEVVAQLLNSQGECWESVLPPPAKKNDAKKYQAKTP